MASPPQTECLIAAGLGSQIFLPDNPKYITSNRSYFNNSTKLHPAYFFQPRTTTELATAVKALSDVDQPFAVRFGGCTISAGSNNIDGGVTIELGLLKSVEYDSKTDTANVGSGATWQEVYDKLEKHQRVMNGGRAGSVGVGGYLLGGGLSFYTGLHGFACDNVVAYEVVLANGSIIIASADEHDDLFRVLKGGSNNFGIVTRFTLRTLPNGPVWGGVSVKPVHGLPRASLSLVYITANASNDPASIMIFVAGHQPKLGGEVIMTLTFHTAGVEKPKAFDQFMSLPETFMIKASELLLQLGKDLENRVSDGDFNTHVAFLPIPRLYAEKAEAAGGNVLGLDHLPYDAIMLQASASVRTAGLADWVRPRIQTLLDDVHAFAVSREGFVDWKYLSYAHDSQDVLQGYGQDNVQKIREAAAKYDPKGVFQRLCSGGFKISAVKD
ncbi:Bifunctional solanapyrone synthase [Cytospora mali]|uniref:Bifunctional solanapyrone synthase n=1 Tax=Cytospora mali TaxID=578113 RepID=A0A194WE13_CYTMA|nr:Bifunctional solanapyrone synthase [Valsa mali]